MDKKGRPYKYGEPLVNVTYGIPKSKIKELNEFVKKLKEQCETKNLK